MKSFLSGGATLVACLMVATTASGADWHDELRTPSPEFSQMPFWFWNDNLQDGEILKQMADFRAHGVYGFVIHARIGLANEIEYMGPRWLGHVKTAVDEAARTNMRVCLYDEAMYPSGSAHGEVVRENAAFAAQGLLLAEREVTGPAEMSIERPCGHVATILAKRIDPKRLEGTSLKVVSESDKTIQVPAGKWQILTFSQVPSEGRIRGVHEGEDDHQPNAPAAADLLNPAAMKVFIHHTYDPYYATLKEHFGKTVIGMFTDEPSLLGRAPRRGLKPWTGGFEKYFETKRGYSILPLLPALFADIGEKTGMARQAIELTIAERLDETYYSQLSAWCGAHGIALTGHPAGANEIQPLRYFQIPGQDLVWRGVVPDSPRGLEGANAALPKCSSSVARHDARSRNSDEIYGAFGWQLTIEEMKWLADWMMVRGVNLFYPHAFYYSIRDQRVNERPPDLGPNNLWWPHYRSFADYTSRLCGLLARSTQVCGVAILCENDRLPWRAAKALHQHQVDFNYLEDWRLLEQAKLEGGALRVGPAGYRFLIVDQDTPPTGKLAERITECERAGIAVRYCREAAGNTLLDGMPRTVTADPPAADLRGARLSRDGREFFYLVNEGAGSIDTTITVGQAGRSEWFDAWTGKFSNATPSKVENGTMSFPLHLERRSSIVLCVDPASPAVIKPSHLEREVYKRLQTLDQGWTVSRPDNSTIAIALGDWLKQPATADYTGTLRYRATFTLHPSREQVYRLDAGSVGDFAVVRVNGQNLGVRFWAPFVWDISGAIKDGENEVVIEVTNSIARRYDAKSARPSGLFGPINIEAAAQKKAMD